MSVKLRTDWSFASHFALCLTWLILAGAYTAYTSSLKDASSPLRSRPYLLDII